MKFITATLLTSILSFISGLFLPWWGIALMALAVAAIIHQKAGKAFLAGLLGVFLLWAGLAWWIDMKNEGYLSAKIATLLPLGGSSFVLIVVTALIGALVGGFGAMTGSFMRSSGRKSS